MKESLLLAVAGIAGKIKGWCPPNAITAKSVFDRLMINGHQVEKDGSNNRILIIPPVFEKEIFFYLRRNSTDAIILYEILYRQDYRHLLLIQKKLNCSITRIVDAGANIGSSTVYLKAVFPAATIISIEPEADNFAMLQKNVAANHFENVHCLQAGLWNKDALLQVQEGFRGDKERELSFYVTEVAADAPGNKICGLTLENIMNRFSFTQVDILKIDIEGAERYLFSSLDASREFLQHVKILAIEVHEEVMDKFALVDFLEQLGYSQITFGEILYAYKDQ